MLSSQQWVSARNLTSNCSLFFCFLFPDTSTEVLLRPLVRRLLFFRGFAFCMFEEVALVNDLVRFNSVDRVSATFWCSVGLFGSASLINLDSQLSFSATSSF